MLINKNNSKKETENYEDNIQSMKSWVRKIEQSADSIGSRLSAVEKRLSYKKFESSDDPSLETETPGGSKRKIVLELKENQDADYIIRTVENKLVLLHDELKSHQIEINSFNGKIENFSKLLDELKKEIKKTKEIEVKFLIGLRNRLEKIEQRAPPIMKLGKIEIPIEIAGVIAGVIAIIAAIFVAINQSGLLVSPAFLSIIGCIFIGSALFKSFKTR